MSATAAQKQLKKSSRQNSQKIPPSIPLHTDTHYSVTEAAKTMRVSNATVWRAIYNDHLKAHRIGNRVVLSGQQLIEWRDRGGKTTQK